MPISSAPSFPRTSLSDQSPARAEARAQFASTRTPWPRPRNDGSPHRVLILGDSMAATDFGRALETLLNRHRGLEARRKGKSSTGLARPDFYDWMAEGARQVAGYDPDLVVVVIGGNDGQDLVDPARGKRRVQWNQPEWRPAYGERVRELATTLVDVPHRRLMWIALPIMARQRLEAKLSTIRAVQREVLLAQPRVEYLETGPWFRGPSGALLDKVSINGREAPLRQEDGIHFSLAGARWFAKRVEPEVVARFETAKP